MSRRGLSDRELAVVAFLGEGRSVSQIAQGLGLSVKTVSTFRHRALEKLKGRGLIEPDGGTAALIRYAIKEGLAK